jgi:Zn-finger nucleic acid-binding protein
MPLCQNCAGPLPAAGPICQYCGSRNSVDLGRVHRFTANKPHLSRTCPNCQGHLFTHDLSAQDDKKFLVERCETCHGLFFDSGELDAVLDSLVSNVFQIDFSGLQAMGEIALSENKVRYRKCPVCGKYMNRVNYGSRSGVITDQCGPHGVWLEPGELRRLLEWRKAGGRLYHEEVMKEKAGLARKKEEERKKRLNELKRQASEYGSSSGF